MKQTFDQLTKNEIFEAINDKEIFISYQGKKHPAKFYGAKLEYPFIAEPKFNGLQAEINWHQAKKLSDGIINFIKID